jgi:hypothetical protein
MKGYVMNRSNIWMHAMKRAIAPGQKVELGELYEQYGIKHGLAEGEEFVQWLRNVKLKDQNKWRVILETEQKSETADGKTETTTQEEEVKKEKSVDKKSKPVVADRVTPLVPDKMGVADVVALSVRQGREVLPKVKDLNLLKYALQEANQLAGKDSLCREIRKRIKALQIAR